MIYSLVDNVSIPADCITSRNISTSGTHLEVLVEVKGKSIPVIVRGGPWGSETSRL
jgi:hypothetical protein